MAAESLRCGLHRGVGFDLVRAEGELAMGTAPALRRRLAKALADRGRVVLDLSCLTLGTETALTVLPTVLAQAGGWPRSRLVLFGATGPMSLALRARGIGDLVPVRDTLLAAVVALDARPDRVQRTTWLAGEPGLVAETRAFVGTCLDDWSARPDESASGACLGDGRVPVGAYGLVLRRVGGLARAIQAAVPDAVPELSVELGTTLRIGLRVWTTRPAPPVEAGAYWTLTDFPDGFGIRTDLPLH